MLEVLAARVGLVWVVLPVEGEVVVRPTVLAVLFPLGPAALSRS